jgi:hypothetical protein
MSITDVEGRFTSHYVEPLKRLVEETSSVGHARGNIGSVVLGGRLVLVWLPAFALVATPEAPLSAVVTASLVTAVWFVALRAAFANCCWARSSPGGRHRHRARQRLCARLWMPG